VPQVWAVVRVRVGVAALKAMESKSELPILIFDSFRNSTFISTIFRSLWALKWDRQYFFYKIHLKYTQASLRINRQEDGHG